MTSKAGWLSLIDRLVADLDGIEADLLGLLDISEIRYVNPNDDDSPFFILAPSYRWGNSDDSQTLARIALGRRFGPWRERVAMLTGDATRELRDELDETLGLIDSWIGRDGHGWDVPHTIAEARDTASERIERARSALRTLGAAGEGGVHLVPDTSALMREPELAAYAAVAGEAATIHLVPTVIGEIDMLKDQGRTEDVRTRAAGMARRIKGLRDRGRLTEGVTVAGRLTAIADAREPSFEHLPGWLDRDTPDDRILAAALLLQANNPSAVVVLVADDINIQNKAETVGLPYADPPDGGAAS